MSACAKSSASSTYSTPKPAHFLVRQRVGCEHPAADPAQDPGDIEADAASADDPGGFAVEVKSEEPGEGEIPFAHAIKSAVQLAIEREDERKGVLRDRMRRVARDACDLEAEARGRGEVDVIVAGATQRDHPRASGRESLEDRGVEHIVHEDADRAETLREHHRLQAEARFEEMQLVPGVIRCLEKGAVVGLGAEDSKLHSPLAAAAVFAA